MENDISKELERVTRAVDAVGNQSFVNGVKIDLANADTKDRLDTLISILNTMKGDKSSAEKTGLTEDQLRYLSLTFDQIEDHTGFTYRGIWTVQNILRNHFAEVEANAIVERNARKESSEKTKETLENLSGDLTNYFEDLIEAEEEKEDSKGIIGNMMGGVKTFFGGVFSSGLNKMLKGLQIKVMNTKQIAAAFKPMFAAAGLSGKAAVGGKGSFKDKVAGKAGAVAGKGMGSVIGALATTITKIGNAIVKFIQLMYVGAPLILPLLVAVGVLMIGLYCITDLVIKTFYPLFEMLTKAVVEFFPQVLETIAASTPWGAMYMMVKQICKLIAALAGVDMENPTAKRDDTKETTVYAPVLNDIKNLLMTIASSFGFTASEKEVKSPEIKSAASTFESAATTIEKNTESNSEKVSSTNETKTLEIDSSNAFSFKSLLTPIAHIDDVISNYCGAVKKEQTHAPISGNSSSQITTNNFNNVNMNQGNSIKAADGIIQGGNNISNATSFSNTSYTDVNKNDDATEKEILSTLKSILTKLSDISYTSQINTQVS